MLGPILILNLVHIHNYCCECYASYITSALNSQFFYSIFCLLRSLQNDSLMRLPSQTSVDAREILRSIALQMTVDGPEQVVLADEYINDQFTESINRPPPPQRMLTRLEKVR